MTNPTDLPKCNDGPIMKLWREAGLPEYFLGNGGTNHNLVKFAELCRTQPQSQTAQGKATDTEKRPMFSVYGDSMSISPSGVEIKEGFHNMQFHLGPYAPAQGIEGLDEAINFEGDWQTPEGYGHFRKLRIAATRYAAQSQDHIVDANKLVPARDSREADPKCKDCHGKGGWEDTDEPKYNEGWINCSCIYRTASPPAAMPVNEALDDKHKLAEYVRLQLDRKSCPDAYMRIAYEAVIDYAALTPAIGDEERAYTDEQIYAWQETHDLIGMSKADARCAYEDAASGYLLNRALKSKSRDDLVERVSKLRKPQDKHSPISVLSHNYAIDAAISEIEKGK